MLLSSALRRLYFSFLLLPVLASAQTTVTTGGGATNQIPKFTSGSQIVNSAITESNGNVGIGTASLNYALNVSGEINASSVQNAGSYSNSLSLGVADNSNIYGAYITARGRDFSVADQYGFLGFTADARNASPSSGNIAFYQFDGANWNSRLQIIKNGNVGIGTIFPSARLEVNGSLKLTTGSGASMTYPDGTVQSTAWNGTTCGGDYVESVDVAGDRASYEPGDVLVIDPKHPGSFLKATESYATSVTGIFSTKPGLTGRRQLTPKNDEEVPMAMMGIVPTKVSAENGPIHPGDLLVSSSTPGYAMKGTDRSKMLGAVIGKALGDLDKDTGVMEVVVTLQ